MNKMKLLIFLFLIIFYMSKYKIEPKNNDSELYRRTTYNYPTRGVFSPSPGAIFAVDLVDMSTKPSNGYKYILNCVDVFSRKAHAVCMSSKNISSIKSALQECFSSLMKPQKIWSDQEAALLSNDMKSYFKALNIVVYHTYGYKSRASIVERFNLTMKNALARFGRLKDWSKYVTEFVNVYNDTVHSSINTTPNKAFSTEQSQTLQKNVENVNEPRPQPKSVLKVGDTVRIQIKKETFAKSSTTPNWSSEVFTIYEVIQTNPITYKIKDAKNEVLQGSFYRQELLATNN